MERVIFAAQSRIFSFLGFGTAQEKQRRPEQNQSYTSKCLVIACRLVQVATQLLDAALDPHCFRRMLVAI